MSRVCYGLRLAQGIALRQAFRRRQVGAGYASGSYRSRPTPPRRALWPLRPVGLSLDLDRPFCASFLAFVRRHLGQLARRPEQTSVRVSTSSSGLRATSIVRLSLLPPPPPGPPCQARPSSAKSCSRTSLAGATRTQPSSVGSALASASKLCSSQRPLLASSCLCVLEPAAAASMGPLRPVLSLRPPHHLSRPRHSSPGD